MKRIVSFFIAAFAMLAISAGITSCDKDSIAVAKLLGTWKTEKMVVSIIVDGKTVTQTVPLDQGDDEMIKTMTYTSDGKVTAKYKNGQTDTAEWEYSDGKLTWHTEYDEEVAFEFNVDELTRKSLIISMTEDAAQISYYFKK